jgi:hypothetical protein
VDPDPDTDAYLDTDAHPDPSTFTDLQDANKKPMKKKFFCILLFELIHNFSKVKIKKEVTNQ